LSPFSAGGSAKSGALCPIKEDGAADAAAAQTSATAALCIQPIDDRTINAVSPRIQVPQFAINRRSRATV